MRKVIIITILVMLASLTFAQQRFERVDVYAEGDSLVIKYVLSQDMEFWAVNSDGTMIGPQEAQSLKSATLWFDKKGVAAFIKPEGIYSKIPWPKTGTHDFTWEFQTVSSKAFSLVDKFSTYATSGNSKDQNRHFEFEVTKNKTVIPRGNVK